MTRIDLKALDKYEGISYDDDVYPPFHHAHIDLADLDGYGSYVRQNS